MDYLFQMHCTRLWNIAATHRSRPYLNTALSGVRRDDLNLSELRPLTEIRRI